MWSLNFSNDYFSVRQWFYYLCFAAAVKLALFISKNRSSKFADHICYSRRYWMAPNSDRIYLYRVTRSLQSRSFYAVCLRACALFHRIRYVLDFKKSLFRFWLEKFFILLNPTQLWLSALQHLNSRFDLTKNPYVLQQANKRILSQPCLLLSAKVKSKRFLSLQIGTDSKLWTFCTESDGSFFCSESNILHHCVSDLCFSTFAFHCSCSRAPSLCAAVPQRQSRKQRRLESLEKW